MESGSKYYDYNQWKVGPNTTTKIQSKVGPNPTTIIQFDAGQNPTLNYMRRILTRTMDMLLEFCIAGQNPTRVKILRNSPSLCYWHRWYTCERRDRVDRGGGGILTYIRNSISYHRLSILECDEVESLWLLVRDKCMPRNFSHILVGVG